MSVEARRRGPKYSSTPSTPSVSIHRALGENRHSSTWRSNLQKTVDYTRTPSRAQRLESTRRGITVTPHGKAAQRALYLRTGLTPAGNRRKDERDQQRITPRDNLRALSRLLAEKSRPNVPNIEASAPLRSIEDDEGEDESEISRPRLSLALKLDEEDDDSFLLPPESAGLENENITVKSIELPRRATSQQPASRMSRGSFGSNRMSDVFTELSDMGSKINVDEVSYLINLRKENPSLPPNDDSEYLLEGTGTLKFPLGNNDMFSPVGQEIDVQQVPFSTEDTGTFLFNLPFVETLTAPKSEEVVYRSKNEGKFIKNNNFEVDDRFDSQSNTETSRIGLESQSPIVDRSLATSKPRPVRRKRVKLSRHGLPYPSFSEGMIKKLATTYAKTAGDSKPRISKETLEAIMQATDWFFEQAGDDLRAYAMHAGRKTINESDVITLMRRQRQINTTITPFFLAQRYLPAEILQELRLETYMHRK